MIQGNISFHINLSIGDMYRWHPGRISQFFRGIAQIIEAQGLPPQHTAGAIADSLPPVEAYLSSIALEIMAEEALD
jgi:hypothetical protein